jgi:hypothetical protein
MKSNLKTNGSPTDTLEVLESTTNTEYEINESKTDLSKEVASPRPNALK